jgi:3-phosphoglycerate kinase
MEEGFHPCFIRSAADEFCGGTASQEQVHGIDNDRLAGAGFSGQNVEARFELNLKMPDDGEVGDGELNKHSRSMRALEKANANGLVVSLQSNPKSEARNPKQYTMTKIQMTKTVSRWVSVLNIGAFVL